MFGSANSIEPIGPVVAASAKATKRAVDEPLVREATAADFAASAHRQKAAGTRAASVQAEPVKALPVPGARTGLFSRREPEPVQPDAVSERHNLYVAEKRGTRTYFADYQQKQEVMRAGDKRITTKQDDRQTVTAVLDLAEERGWQTLRLRGTESFRREAWVQAQVRGIETEGYKATATDTQEVTRRLNAVAPVPVPVERADAKPVEAAAVKEPALAASKPVPVAAAVQAPAAAPVARAAPAPAPAESPAKVAPVAPKPTRKASAKAAAVPESDKIIVTSHIAPAEMSKMASDLGVPVKDSASGVTLHPVKAAAKPAESAKAAEPAKPAALSDAQAARIFQDAKTLGEVWGAIRDPNADPARLRMALDREPPADRQRLTAEVMAGLERRAAETGNRTELERITPHLSGQESAVKRAAAQSPAPLQQGQQPAPRATSDEMAAKRDAMSPEQRDAVSKAALGMLHPSRAPQREKDAWGNVEAVGRTARESGPFAAPVAKAGERPAAEGV